MDSELKAKLAGILRTSLAFLGGVAVTKKWVDQETLNAIIEVGIGLVPLGIGVWSWWQKAHQAKIVEAAILAPSSATVEQVIANVDAKTLLR